MSETPEERLQRLEETIAHQAKEIEDLSALVRDQWGKIDQLTTAMMRFRDRLTEVEEAGESPHAVTKPPHY